MLVWAMDRILLEETVSEILRHRGRMLVKGGRNPSRVLAEAYRPQEGSEGSEQSEENIIGSWGEGDPVM